MTVKTINYKGYDIDIKVDELAECPDFWGNEDLFLVYDHRDFCIERKGYDPTEIYEHCMENKKWFYEGYYVFPVFAYIHSGVSLSLGNNSYPFNDQWDVSMKGFVLLKRMKGWSWQRNKAKKIAPYLITEWNQYLSGDVYYYNVDEANESCGGFYGHDFEENGLLEYARNAIDCYINQQMKVRFEKLKTYIKYRTPLEKRIFPQISF